MFRNYYLILMLIFFSPINAQKFDSKMDSIIRIKISALKKSGVTEIGFRTLTCVNYGVYNTTFLFWNKKDKTYLQKFENSEYEDSSLKKYKPIEINDTLFFPFFKLNKAKIEKEKVLPFQYQKDSLDIKNGIKQRIISMHTCTEYFEIDIEKTIFKYKYDYFDTREFDTEKIDNSKLTKEDIEKWEKRGLEVDTKYENHPVRNINFEHNRNLIILNWNKRLEKVVELLELEKKFVVQN